MAKESQMPRIIIYTLLGLAVMLTMGIHSLAYGMDMNEVEEDIRVLFMTDHINTVCESNLSPQDIVFVGQHEDALWYYTPYNATCQYTGEFSNVWSIPVSYIK
jgi:hypothetical protein